MDGSVQEGIVVGTNCDLVPVLLGAVVVDVGQSLHTAERFLINGGHAGRNIDFGHDPEILEGPVTNSCQLGILRNDDHKRATMSKSVIGNNLQSNGKGYTTIQHIGLIKRTLANACQL